MAFSLLEPVGKDERAANVRKWIQPQVPCPLDIPITVDLQVSYHVDGADHLVPLVSLNALDCLELNLLKDKIQASDYFVEDYLGDPTAYKLIVRFTDHEYYWRITLDGTTAKQVTAATTYQWFLEALWKQGRQLRDYLEDQGMQERERVKRDNEGKVKPEEPEEPEEDYIADVWAKFEVYFGD